MRAKIPISIKWKGGGAQHTLFDSLFHLASFDDMVNAGEILCKTFTISFLQQLQLRLNHL